MASFDSGASESGFGASDSGVVAGASKAPLGIAMVPNFEAMVVTSPLRSCSINSSARLGVQSIFETHLFAPAFHASFARSGR